MVTIYRNHFILCDIDSMSAEAPTASELLTAVNAAILALITKKIESYTIVDVTYHYNDLDKLRAMRKELQKECRTTSNTIRLADVSDA